jgi:glycosyltransferase involved in cell wall biosynthesis
MENSTKYVYRKLETRNENYIVIVINQFLGEKHSASVRALDYCHAIKKYLHKNVLIINTSELNFYRNPQLEPSIEFNFVDQLSTISRYTYKGEDFDFYQVNSKMLNLGEIKWLIDSIYNINPLFVYNIGGSNITADLCTRFTTTASIPCSYDIPISCSKYLLVGRKLRENDKDILKLMKPYQKIIETEMNFIIAEKEATYTRKDFNIDENSFIICVVGSRLDTEVNNDFLQLVKKVIYNSDINIVFIGGMARSQAIINDILDEHKSKIHFLGVQPNASEIIRLTNLYLNPRRLGGGRSSFEALHYSVPVVTTNYGDVSYVCDNAFNVQDYDEAYQSIMEYYTNQQYYETMKKVALSRSKKLSSIEATQKYIIDAIIADETHDIL